MARLEVRTGDRTITVYDEGARDGPAILQHDGTPLGGPPFPPWVEDARARGARLISYDRPGYGDSTPSPGRMVADAAADCAAIMDALGIERFVTWGISGGGPHALACAALLPDRVSAVASLGGVAPFDAPGLNYFRGMGEDNLVEFGLAMAGREHLEPFAEQMATQMKGASAGTIREAMETLVSGPDGAVLDGPFGEHWSAVMPVTFANGAAGWIDDDLAFTHAFGFELKAIRAPALVVHGRHDQFVPIAHAQWLAQAIPGAEAWLLEDDGHLTLIAHRVPAVHEWLLARL